ncbi:MAG: ArsA family ATPase [Myxococcota bacterium]
MSQLTSLLESKSTLIVVGPGGVGKTTAAAALAVQGARMGKKVLVLTVDPARRLANSLGLEGLESDEVRIEPSLFAEAGIELGSGALYAMMLDTKSTFDRLIERHAPDAETRDRILGNRYYQQASTALAGSQEYMAMEKLYEVREERDYDLIVLDTPPMQNAVDFLSAPDRLGRFLDSSSLRVVLTGFRTAGKFGMGLLKFQSRLLRVMNRFVGAETFLSLLEFIDSFQEMYGGFRKRANRVKDLFGSPDVAFAIITSTDRMAIDEGEAFHRRLVEDDMPFGAFVVNRVREPYLPEDAREGLADHLLEAVDEVKALEFHDRNHVVALVKRIARACDRYEVLSEVDRDRVAEVREHLGEAADRLWTVPLFDRDIHDLRGLADFADVIFREDEAA